MNALVGILDNTRANAVTCGSERRKIICDLFQMYDVRDSSQRERDLSFPVMIKLYYKMLHSANKWYFETKNFFVVLIFRCCIDISYNAVISNDSCTNNGPHHWEMRQEMRQISWYDWPILYSFTTRQHYLQSGNIINKYGVCQKQLHYSRITFFFLTKSIICTSLQLEMSAFFRILDARRNLHGKQNFQH